MLSKKIAFIGAGNMAFAIIKGLIRSGYPAGLIAACNKSNQVRLAELQQLGVQIAFSNCQAVKWADCVVLAIKPQVMAEVCEELAKIDFTEKWLLSIAAGISVARLTQLLPTANQIIRAMPNTPALVGEGMTGLFAEKTVNSSACQFVESLLNAVGKCYWVTQESQINQIIAITGSSPAYFFRFMEAMQKSAVAMGFSQQDARELIQSVALGAAKMVQENPELPLSQLRENVTSKGGTTAQALAVFEQYQLDKLVEDAMNAAILRAEEMEKSL